jgi:predicted AAA+ superfamily ATPase
MGLNIPAPMFRRFWTMLAHGHGQLWNAADPSASLGVSQPTVRKYLDYLDHLLMVRQLQPWHENLGKRQVKSPKIYVRDSGLLHLLLGIRNEKDFQNHPKRGASWEGYVLEELIRHHRVDADSCYFWAVHEEADLDLIILKEGKMLGFEFKYAEAPAMTRSLRNAQELLKLDSVTLICPGKTNFPLSDSVRVSGLETYLGLKPPN